MREAANRAALLLADDVSYDHFRKPGHKDFQPAILFHKHLKLLLQFCISGKLIERGASLAVDAVNACHKVPLV